MSADAQTIEALLAGLSAVPALRAEVAELRAEVAALKAERQRARARSRWLTKAETAEVLRCSEKTITRMIAAGKLRRDLESFKVRIRADDVEAYAGRVTLPHFG